MNSASFSKSLAVERSQASLVLWLKMAACNSPKSAKKALLISRKGCSARNWSLGNSHKAAAIATAHGMDEVFVAQRVQGFADGDVRHPHQFGQFCLVGQLFVASSKPVTMAFLRRSTTCSERVAWPSGAKITECVIMESKTLTMLNVKMNWPQGGCCDAARAERAMIIKQLLYISQFDELKTMIDTHSVAVSRD